MYTINWKLTSDTVVKFKELISKSLKITYNGKSSIGTKRIVFNKYDFSSMLQTAHDNIKQLPMLTCVFINHVYTTVSAYT